MRTTAAKATTRKKCLRIKEVLRAPMKLGEVTVAARYDRTLNRRPVTPG
jgi:hypothetical protein